MTYNFDADRWLDNELAAIVHQVQHGRLTEAEAEVCRQALFARYDDMVDRLDGTYRIPPDE